MFQLTSRLTLPEVHSDKNLSIGTRSSDKIHTTGDVRIELHIVGFPICGLGVEIDIREGEGLQRDVCGLQGVIEIVSFFPQLTY